MTEADRATYPSEVGSSDLLGDREGKACPNCLEPMQPAGSARELLIADTAVADRSAYWECAAYGMIAVA